MNIKKYILGTALAATTLFSCTDGFDEMNENPWTGNDLDVKHQFTYTQLKMFASGHEGFRGNLIMTGPYAGNTANLYSTGIGFGLSDSYTNATWELIYGDVMKNLVDAMGRLEAEGGQDDKIAQFRIVKVVNLLRATLLYGDIPYFDAGKGYSDLIYYPKYDRQEDILKDMVNELRESRDLLAASGSEIFTYDLYDSGVAGPTKYIKLANSLLMRIGLTMSEADATEGASIFQEAYTNDGGYISNWGEAVYVRHVEDGGPWGQHVNGTGVAIEGQVGGFSYGYMSEKALKSMQEKEDPRIFRLVSHLTYESGISKSMTDVAKYRDFDPFAQAGEDGEFKRVHYRGVRMGDRGDGNRGLYYKPSEEKVYHASYWVNQNTDYKFEEGGQFATLAGLSPATFNRLTPTMVMGADEVQFMIAEAANIGYIGADARSAFQAGIEFALSKYDAMPYPGKETEQTYEALYISQTNPSYNHETAVSNYIQNAMDRYDAASDKREEIIYEHWMADLGDGYKSYEIWNRTHMPSMVVPDINAAGEDYVELASFEGDPTIDHDLDPIGSESIHLHTGGVTDGIRPSRFPYPNRELTVNSANADEAMQRQRSESGTGAATNFIAVKQWYSHK
ncbi:SusD/RagB family nutrient-binding outer membrane lipoprotein [Sediminitomix flava]|uniref:SusD-like starch-binding protein associating with outer membrane n=1 Tax=Sediminitomix flava TaxID=379075 RepID=A0A315ZXX8_SEDFL|nr:SusD/RagB family nutrient-binding outer membrane lipoprotein [Sediminitomix flava]PWJ42187.1 SusD-like starch-binding protein associating with outer membrane [Sediminitomix flava]